MNHRILNNLVLALLVACCAAVSTHAQGGQTAAPAAASSQSATPIFRAEFLRVLEDTEKKMVSLAEAMPPDKYSWRPMEGVRSVSEVFIHMAMMNFNSPRFLGAKPPVTVDASLEKITDKAKVVDLLKQSFAHMRQAALSVPEADWNKTVTFNNRNIVTGEALIRTLIGLREHLGQSVAYARMNRIVPPWTAAQQRSSMQ